MKLQKIIKRFLLPSPFVSLFYFVKFKCKISPRAEVEINSFLKIGKNSQIGSFAKIKANNAGPLVIGQNVFISNGCFINSDQKEVAIGDDCMIGPNVTIVGGNYKYDRLDIPVWRQGTVSKGISIGRNVWVGAGCSIIDGSEIGDDVIISPNSVVSARIPARSIVQGNPAKVIFTRR